VRSHYRRSPGHVSVLGIVAVVLVLLVLIALF
jgi:hypothetical protein